MICEDHVFSFFLASSPATQQARDGGGDVAASLLEVAFCLGDAPVERGQPVFDLRIRDIRFDPGQHDDPPGDNYAVAEGHCQVHDGPDGLGEIFACQAFVRGTVKSRQVPIEKSLPVTKKLFINNVKCRCINQLTFANWRSNIPERSGAPSCSCPWCCLLLGSP